MDAVSGLFLNALGTDMVTMEEYFPFITKAFDVMQYTAWAVLFLIVVWQLFRAFGGPITEADNPWQLVVRGAIFALLIGYAKPIFMLALDIARAPYTALMDVSMTAEEFTFAGVEQVLSKGDQRRGTQRKERRQRVRQGRFDCNRNRRRGQRLCIRLCQQIQG